MQKLVFSMACVVAIAATACSPETTDSTTTTQEATPEATSATEQPASNLKTLDEGYVSAQYPAELEANVGGSGEGSITIFTLPVASEDSEDVELSIFLPSGSADQSVEDYLADFIYADNGLITSNGWQILELETATRFSADDYPWMDTVIDFETDLGVVGHIMVGKVNGQTVQTILQYPLEEVDTYLPMMKTVLDSVTFDESQLPLPASQV